MNIFQVLAESKRKNSLKKCFERFLVVVFTINNGELVDDIVLQALEHIYELSRIGTATMYIFTNLEILG